MCVWKENSNEFLNKTSINYLTISVTMGKDQE